MVVADSQTTVLECEVANPSSEGKWLKDGQPIDFNENVLSEVNGAVRRLIIAITKATNIGEYTYQVASSKTSANLKVEGRSTLCESLILKTETILHNLLKSFVNEPVTDTYLFQEALKLDFMYFNSCETKPSSLLLANKIQV